MSNLFYFYGIPSEVLMELIKFNAGIITQDIEKIKLLFRYDLVAVNKQLTNHGRDILEAYRKHQEQIFEKYRSS